MSSFRILLFVGFSFLFGQPVGLAQQSSSEDVAYPTRPVRIVVPQSTGGSADVLSRILTARLSETLGIQLVVDNRPGGNEIIGTEIVAKAPADGYTLLMTSNSQSANASMHAKLPYDTLKDFAPVVQVAFMPILLAVHPSQPIHSLSQLVALAKAKPGTLTFAHAGIGSPARFSGELLKLMANIDIVQVPYKGGGPAVADAIGGQVSMVLAGLPAIIPHVRSGKLRAIAATSPKRSPILPDVPTIAELGYPDFNYGFWIALVAPRDMPRGAIRKLNAAVNTVLARQDTIEQFARQGAEPVGGTPQQLDAFIRKDIDTTARIVRAAGIKAE